jgi:hypothetical protein
VSLLFLFQLLKGTIEEFIGWQDMIYVFISSLWLLCSVEKGEQEQMWQALNKPCVTREMTEGWWGGTWLSTYFEGRAIGFTDRDQMWVWERGIEDYAKVWAWTVGSIILYRNFLGNPSRSDESIILCFCLQFSILLLFPAAFNVTHFSPYPFSRGSLWSIHRAVPPRINLGRLPVYSLLCRWRLAATKVHWCSGAYL